MQVLAAEKFRMHVQAALVGERLEHLAEDTCVEVPDLALTQREAVRQPRPPAEVDGHPRQRIVHRDDRRAESSQPLLVAQRLAEGLSQHQADILNHVVIVDLQVPPGRDLEIEKRMPGQRFEHVVDERHTGSDLEPAAAVQIQLDPDLCLPGLTRHAACSAHRSISSTASRKRFISSSVPTEMRR